MNLQAVGILLAALPFLVIFFVLIYALVLKPVIRDWRAGLRPGTSGIVMSVVTLHVFVYILINACVAFYRVQFGG
jgi:hypothetical protein